MAERDRLEDRRIEKMKIGVRVSLRASAALIALAMISTGCRTPPGKDPECNSARRCVETIERVAEPGESITDAEVALAERIQRHGSKAVEPLIRLLDSHDEDVRSLAIYTLWGIDGLAPRHVKPILAAALRSPRAESHAWVLARIDSPEAVDGMIRILRAHPVTFSPIGAALSEAVTYDVYSERGVLDRTAYPGLGARALSALMALVESKQERDEDLLSSAIEILATSGLEALADPRPLAALLASIAADSNRSLPLRRTAIAGLGCMMTDGAAALPVLRSLADAVPEEIAIDASVAILMIEGPKPDTRFVSAFTPFERRAESPIRSCASTLELIRDHHLYFSLAALWTGGDRARHAGPALIRLLGADVPGDVRVQAAWNLGFLGDSTSGPGLVSLLDSEDWLLVSAASDSLGRLNHREAREALAGVADGHWYPPVREVARRAVSALDGRHSYPALAGDGSDGFRSVQQTITYQAASLPDPSPAACVDPASDVMAPREERHFNSASDAAAAARHVYVADVVFGFSPGSERREVTPDFGTRGDDGWFLAESLGEFGGELMFSPDGGQPYLVARGNFEDVHHLIDGRWVALEGLAHLGSDSGDVFELRKSQGRWAAYAWRRLPGMPLSSWERLDGTLLINTTRGSVVLHPDGRFEMAKCSAPPTPGTSSRP